ncbi:probable inactive leucine-rich repeat receptor-like protein kinase, partial [Tanacetum coccineum]
MISETSKLGTQVAPSCRVFSKEELAEATDNFSGFLGEGSIGKLYKGRLENGSYIVIRVLSKSSSEMVRSVSSSNRNCIGSTFSAHRKGDGCGHCGSRRRYMDGALALVMRGCGG